MSIRFEVKRLFRVPIEQTYNRLLDLETAKNWMQGFVRLKRLDDGEMSVGSEWLETRKMFGQEATEHFEVIELQKNKKIVLRSDGTKGTTGKGEFIFTYIITERDGDSEIALQGGEVILPIQKTDWSPSYGQVKDKYGITWQISTVVE